MRIIPTYFHGVLDYLVGVLLIVAPNVFGFAEYGGAAVSVPRILGVVIIAYSLFTKYELGIIKGISMGTHLGLDLIGGILLAASPWIFRFADLPQKAWMPHLIIGIGEALIAAISQTVPRRTDLETREAVARRP